MEKSSRYTYFVIAAIFLQSCANIPLEGTSSFYSNRNAQATTSIYPPGDMRWCVHSPLVHKKLNQDINFDDTPTIESFCQTFRDENPLHPQCYEDCEKRFSDGFYRIKTDKEQRELAEKEANERRIAAQEEEKRKALIEKQQAELEKQKKEELEENLRAGIVAPENIEQAAIAYGATNGIDLVGSPKIRPDNKIYSLHGKIEQANDQPEFLAHGSYGRINDYYARAFGRNGLETKYFKVIVPEEIQSYYFEQARIGGGFDLVGRYVSNITYTTVSGAEKMAPVFEAVYLLMW